MGFFNGFFMRVNVRDGQTIASRIATSFTPGQRIGMCPSRLLLVIKVKVPVELVSSDRAICVVLEQGGAVSSDLNITVKALTIPFGRTG